MNPGIQMPSRDDLLWPTLKVLDASGGSASIQELSSRVSEYMSLTDDILNELHQDGPQTEVDYRAAWARTYLKKIGAIANTSRGVWTITDIGRGIENEARIRELAIKVRAAWNKGRNADRIKASEFETTDTGDEPGWEKELLDILRRMEPDAFERLCQRVLRESGFTRVQVTGSSGDGGIDGVGVLRVRLISFQVRFQCKRYTGSVGTREMRDFRGAMVGRADKGLFITTGAFTQAAQREATRDGAPAIDLIDGSELCHLLRDLGLGVSTRTVQVFTPHAEFFETL